MTLPYIVPERQDHIDAAQLRNLCRGCGVQVGTVDALIAQLCIRHDLQLLTAGADFQHMARYCPLALVGRPSLTAPS